MVDKMVVKLGWVESRKDAHTLCNLGAQAARAWVLKGRGEMPALRWFGSRGEKETYTIREMSVRAGKFANVLRNFGVQRGERVFFLMRNIPDLHWGVQGTLLYGAVAGVLDPEEGPDRILSILQPMKARLLIVEAEWKPWIDRIRSELPNLWQVLVLVRKEPSGRLRAGDFLYADYFNPAEERFTPAPTRSDEAAFLVPAGEGALPSFRPHGVGEGLSARMRTFFGTEPEGSLGLFLTPRDLDFLEYAVLGPAVSGVCIETGESPTGFIQLLVDSQKNPLL